MTQRDVRCPSCQTVQSFADLVPFRAECERCSADLHVCVTCAFYDPYVENACREDQAEPVSQKDRRNLCEYWRPAAIDGAADDAVARAKARLHAAFDGGGGGGEGVEAPMRSNPARAPSPTSAADEARRKLEALFKK